MFVEDGDDVFDGGGLCAAGQGGVDVGPEVVEGVGHGCSPSSAVFAAPVSAGVAGDRRGGARNLEEAVTSGAGFSARASRRAAPWRAGVGPKRSLGLRSSARVWVARDGASSVTLGDPAERLKVRGYGPRPPQAGIRASGRAGRQGAADRKTPQARRSRAAARTRAGWWLVRPRAGRALRSIRGLGAGLRGRCGRGPRWCGACVWRGRLRR
ncbi:Uncharacterised protein [Mycolicibacterium gilvum]|uniref:Uncharacterized protein n=1 Tax=Mycolicibacterium gilvum TaxID=1804 RepID=A0A379MLL0_9MYCO|nr:Uncharacterised protein [Mycolicibacterium gilvum]